MNAIEWNDNLPASILPRLESKAQSWSRLERELFLSPTNEMPTALSLVGSLLQSRDKDPGLQREERLQHAMVGTREGISLFVGQYQSRILPMVKSAGSDAGPTPDSLPRFNDGPVILAWSLPHSYPEVTLRWRSWFPRALAHLSWKRRRRLQDKFKSHQFEASNPEFAREWLGLEVLFSVQSLPGWNWKLSGNLLLLSSTRATAPRDLRKIIPVARRCIELLPSMRLRG